jgi:heat shock protein HslJ
MLKFLALTSIATMLTVASSSMALALTHKDLGKQTWEIAEWQENGSPVTIAPDSSITAMFQNQKIMGVGSCNQFTAQYQLRGTRMKISRPVITNLFNCPPDWKKQESHLSMALGGVKSVSFDQYGRLLLRYQSGELSGQLTFDAHQNFLEKINWQMLQMQNNGVYTSPVRPLEMSFSKDTVTGSSECNVFTANYKRQGNRLTISNMSFTERGCSPKRMNESEFFNAFGNITTFTVDPQQYKLILNFPTGQLFYEKVVSVYE